MKYLIHHQMNLYNRVLHMLNVNIYLQEILFMSTIHYMEVYYLAIQNLEQMVGLHVKQHIKYRNRKRHQQQ